MSVSLSAYFHAVTAHLPLFGVALGLLALAAAGWMKSRGGRGVALLLLTLCAAAVVPVYCAGDQAYKPIRGIADEQGQLWLDLHRERGEVALWVYGGLALVAGTALAANRRQWKAERGWVLATGICAVVSLGVGGWTAQAGGRVRHPEFRPAEPLPVEEAADYELE